MRKNKLGAWKLGLTVFGLGYLPVAPGTMGALGGLLPGIIILKYTNHPQIWLSGLILTSLIIGIIGSNKLEPLWGKDPSKIVIDETAGMWVSMLWLPINLWYVVPAFVFFRFFDIFKPFGMRKTENLKGGTGVMADDILAGVYANLATQVLFIILKEIR